MSFQGRYEKKTRSGVARSRSKTKSVMARIRLSSITGRTRKRSLRPDACEGDRVDASKIVAATGDTAGVAHVSLHQPRTVVDRLSRVDRVFGRLTLFSGMLVLALLALVGVFLLLQSHQAFAESGWSFFTRVQWNTSTVPARIGVFGLLAGTVIVSVIAVVLAVPLGVCAALFITEYAPPGLRRILQGVIDLLAAVPSILFGLWGFLFLADRIVPLSAWIGSHLGWIPIFAVGADAGLVSSYFIAGIVVAMMVLPIVASVTREVFSQTPPGEKEAALALGGTRWGMVRTVVIPFGRGGIVGGSMLGLGRALGEAIAVSLLLPQVPTDAIHILQSGGSTIAGFIAQRAGSDPFTTSGLMAAGLVLFVLTLGVNLGASAVVARSRSGAGVDA
jgi:phosphate transport system permease protein